MASCVIVLTPDHVAATRWLSLGLVGGLLAFMLTACASSQVEVSGPSQDTLSPSQVVSLSSDALSDISTFRFSLSHNGGSTVLTNGIQVLDVSGTAATPNSYRITADTLVSGFFVNSQIVVIGNDSYMTHPITQDWQQLTTGANPFSAFDPVKMVRNILNQVSNTVLTSSNLIPAHTYGVDGQLPAQALATLTGGVDETAPPLKVRLIVDRTSMAPIEARVTGRTTVTESDNLVRTVRLSEFNSDVVIEPPL